MTLNNTNTDGEKSTSRAGCIAEIELTSDALFFADTMAAHHRFSANLFPYQFNSETIRAVLCTNTIDYGFLEDSVRTDPTVKSITYIRTANGTHIYDLEVVPVPKCPFKKIESNEIQLLNARGRNKRWTVLIWISADAIFEDWLRNASKEGIDWDLQRVYRTSSHDPVNDLTPVQRETIELALELGYYNIPRAISMQELAAELDVTPNAISERLRRAEQTLFSVLIQNSAISDISNRS